MFPDMPLPVSSNCVTAPWLPEEAVGDFDTPFVLEKLFDHSFSIELAGSYSGHVPCKFRKVCLGLKEGFCIQFFCPRMCPKTFLKCFALEQHESKARHCRNVLGLVPGRKN